MHVINNQRLIILQSTNLLLSLNFITLLGFENFCVSIIMSNNELFIFSPFIINSPYKKITLINNLLRK